MIDAKGRISPRNALVLLFKSRARNAVKHGGKSNSVYGIIAENLSKDGGSVPNQEPAKERDPNLPQG